MHLLAAPLFESTSLILLLLSMLLRWRLPCQCWSNSFVRHVHSYFLPPFQNKNYVWTKIAFQNKSYVWWNFSQTSPNKLECCQNQCECGCWWWTTKSNNSLHLFNNLIVGLDGVDAHQRGYMRFGAIRPKWWASSEIGTKSFQLYYGHP